MIGKIKLLKDARALILFPPAPPEAIDKFEEKLSLKLPDDIKAFYRFSNGMEGCDDAFTVISLDEIAGNMKQFRENTFLIAEYMVYSETWAVEVSEDDHNEYQIFVIGAEGRPVILTSSFAEFLDRYLKGGVTSKGGLNEWYKEITNKHK